MVHMEVVQSTKFKTWVGSRWQPKARTLTHLLSRTTNFLLKNNVTIETVDAISPNIVELRDAITEVLLELNNLEQKRPL